MEEIGCGAVIVLLILGGILQGWQLVAALGIVGFVVVGLAIANAIENRGNSEEDGS